MAADLSDHLLTYAISMGRIVPLAPDDRGDGGDVVEGREYAGHKDHGTSNERG